mgnify:CR=1|tara:strand:- start:517 stop:693 length:177 start_codon:yes stop_codon:yes gene_type:complete
MSKEEIEQVLIKYIEHVLEIKGSDFISEYYFYDKKWNPSEFTEKEKGYLLKITENEKD